MDISLYALIGAAEDAKLAEEVIRRDYGNLSAESVAAIAPFLPPEQLTEIVRASQSQYTQMSTLLQIAPFLDERLVEALCAGVQPHNIDEVVALAPFISRESCARLVASLENFDLDVGLLSELGPFLPRKTLDQLADKVIPESLTELISVAPFVSQAVLGKMTDRLERITLDDYLTGLEGLMPFLSRDAARKLHGKVVRD